MSFCVKQASGHALSPNLHTHVHTHQTPDTPSIETHLELLGEEVGEEGDGEDGDGDKEDPVVLVGGDDLLADPLLGELVGGGRLALALALWWVW